jgi:hypothetical protein
MMRKIILSLIVIIVTFMIIQTIRYTSKGSNIENLEFTDLKNKKVKLKDIFDDNNNKLILYILPDCGSCMLKINELSKNSSLNKSQVIVISVGLEKFNYNEFYSANFIDNEIIFLIDKENTFYKNFGLGFTENFPTLIKYDLSNDSYKKIY